jgi:hypothetical protein
MKEFRYVYQDRKKYLCPNCGHKTMRRFIDTTTGELLPDHFGVCERVFSCSYENRPEKEIVDRAPVERPPSIPFYFNPSSIEDTLNRYLINILFTFLANKLKAQKTSETFGRYRIGTNFSGDTIFWQIDEEGKIRAGKRIQYFSDGHRNKARGASWLHWSNGFDETRHVLDQCLFGQHLMDSRYKDIFVVESEKTALICDICKKEPDVLFLACGGLQNLGLIAKLKFNPDQRVWVIPDNDGNEIWQQKIDKLNLPAKIKMIPSLQEMKRGSDIGDLLLTKI